MSTEAERSLVGAVLSGYLDPNDTGIRGPHFTSKQLANIWEVALLHDNRTPAGLAAALNREGSLEYVGGLSGLRKLATAPGTKPEHHPGLIQLVRTSAERRSYHTLISRQLSALESGSTNLADLTSQMVNGLEKIRLDGGSQSAATAVSGVQGEIERLLAGPDDAEALPGLPLPWGLQEYVRGGLPPDRVTTLFGPTGGMKTTVANGLSRHLARTGHKVVKFGLEDSADLEHKRLVADLAGIPLGDIIERRLTDQQRERLKRAGGSWLENLVIIEDVVPTASEMIRAYRAIPGVRAVFYDYLQLLDWGSNDERVAIHKFMLEIQRAARRDQVAHVVLSQLKEEMMEAAEGDKRPRHQWLFGSSAIKNMSKLILGVFHPYDYFPNGPTTMGKETSKMYADWYSQNPKEWRSLIEIIVRKNVIGPTNCVVPTMVDLPTGVVRAF